MTLRRPLTCALTALLLTPALDAAAGPEGAKVVLLDAGTGKKSKLRFTPKAGLKQTMVMRMEIEMAMAMGEMKVPAIKAPTTEMDMTLEVKRVAGNGDITYAFGFTDVRVTDTDHLPPQAVAQMKASMEGVKKIHGTATVDATGRTKSADFETGGSLDPQLQQLMGNIKQSMNQLTAPFPTQPVGVGARWKVEMTLDQMGLPMKQVATYELRDHKGRQGTLAISLVQEKTSATANLPNLPPGAEAKILKLDSKGSGEVKFDLNSLGPVLTTTKLKSLIVTEITAGGEKQVMSMDMDMDMRLHLKR